MPGALGWTLVEPRERLSAPVTDDPRFGCPAITVERLEVEADGAALVLDPRIAQEVAGPRRWRMTLPGMLDDLAAESASLASARLIVRASIEEWFHTRRAEPGTAALAVPLPG